MDRAACVQVYALMDPTRIEKCESSEKFGQKLAQIDIALSVEGVCPHAWLTYIKTGQSTETQISSAQWIEEQVCDAQSENEINPVKNLAKKMLCHSPLNMI